VTPDEALAVIAKLSTRLRSRRPDIKTAVSYYKGTEGRLRFASDEFKGYFEKRFAGFSDNWCMPVAQAPVERMKHLGIRLDGPGSKVDTELERTWGASDADRGLSEALLMMTVAKRAFALVSPGPGRARITFEHPDSSIVSYDPVTRQRRYGLTMWEDDGVEHANLYTGSQVFEAERAQNWKDNEDRRQAPELDGWAFTKENFFRSHSFGSVPLVECTNQALLDDDPISDISGVMAMQDSINLTWAYLLHGLDTASLPARIIKGIDVPTEPILDANGQQIGERPIELDRLIRDRIIFVPEGGDIAEWTAGNLEAYSKVIEHAIDHIAAQTRTPPHYLIAKMVNTSGDALTVAEAGLVSKVQERTAYATPFVREIYRLCAIAEGQKAKAERVSFAEVAWSNPQYRSEAQLADALLKKRQIGYPFQYLLELDGLGPADIKRVMEMVREEQDDPYLAAQGVKGAAADGVAAESSSGGEGVQPGAAV